MSATIARQGGRVQLEQSDMQLASSLAEMAKGGFSRGAIGETQFQIKKPGAKVRGEEKWEVEFPGHDNVMAPMERHLAMMQENQTDGCLPCQNGTAQNPQTLWRCKGMGAPPPEQLRQPTPDPTPDPPEMPLVPPGKNEAAHVSEIGGEPPGYGWIHIPLLRAQHFDLDAYAKNRKRDKDFNPDLLTDERTSTG